MSESTPACKKTEQKLLALGYKKKSVYEQFKKGQKYYQITDIVPNCVRSFVCENDNNINTDFNDPKHSDVCVAKKYQYKETNGEIVEKPQPFSNMNPIADGRAKNPQFYYRSCVPFGCKKGTSAIDVIDSSGGRRRRTYKKSRRFRRTRK